MKLELRRDLAVGLAVVASQGRLAAEPVAAEIRKVEELLIAVLENQKQRTESNWALVERGLVAGLVIELAWVLSPSCALLWRISEQDRVSLLMLAWHNFHSSLETHSYYSRIQE